LRIFAVFDQRSPQILDHPSLDECELMRYSLAASVSNLESTAWNHDVIRICAARGIAAQIMPA
jgi:hypothetical protein